MTVDRKCDGAPAGADAGCDARTADCLDPDIAQVLRTVTDPELGVNIADLGLVYAALWTPAGIRVVMTTTSPSCPMADMLADEVRGVLKRAFPEATGIAVELAFTPPWSPDRISAAGREALGWNNATATRSPFSSPSSWPSRLLASFRRH